MAQLDREMVEKYFHRECTPKEVEKVLSWFRTVEGLRYLEKHMDNYIDMERNPDVHSVGLPDSVDSEKIFSGVRKQIREKKKDHELYRTCRPAEKNRRLRMAQRRRGDGFFLKAVAVVLVLTLTMAGYSWFEQHNSIQHSDESATIVHTSGHDQHKLLTLADGTAVRLNENSSLSIPEDYNRNTRRVELAGEAFFDVEHNPELPFEVAADEGLIRVLGTQFNVKVDPANHIQVAVLEGRVALSGEHDPEGSSAILTKGYFGVYNSSSRETTIEEAPVANYISWMDGYLVFEDTPLWKISRQLQWMYGPSFRYADDELRGLRLYASFRKDDLEEVLNIIASTLEIDYSVNGDEVMWKNYGSNQ